jgi:YgiT-type zinc finger domain-containing protein
MRGRWSEDLLLLYHGAEPHNFHEKTKAYYLKEGLEYIKMQIYVIMEKIDYENITPEDLEEEVEIKPHPEGGMPVYCTICDVKMDKIKINVKRGNIEFLNIDAYKCPQCGEEVLDIDTASQLEREFALSKSTSGCWLGVKRGGK